MTVAELIHHYGYLAVFVGSLLEGETILAMAGFAAHQGHLSFAAVVTVGFVGGTLGDQVFYWIGRRWGRPLLQRYPRLRSRARDVAVLMRRYDAALIVGIRFMYGLRIAGPIAIGSARVRAWRFAAYNVLGAALWAPLIAGLGYAFGHQLETWLGDVRSLEGGALGLMAVLILGAHLLTSWMRRRRARRRERRPGAAPRRD
ncbi:MAG: DedA family protein [Betaproteobacteria bacterium]